MEGRMNYIDMARGVAIILVMTGHSILFPACGAIHIPAFFVLAGYVITMEGTGNNTYKECIRKRVLRLLYPYVFYSLALLFLKTLKDVLSGSFLFAETAKDIFGILYSSTCIFNREENKFFCFRVGNEGLWFLTAMASACIVFYLILYKVLRIRYDAVKMAAAMILLVCAGWLLERLPFFLPWGFDIALAGAAFMLFGMMLRRREKIFEGTGTTVVLTVLSGAGFLVLNAINGEANMAIHLYGRSRWLFMLSGFAGSVFIVGACRLSERIRLIEGVLSYVGKNTLFILAFHTMVFGVYDKVFEMLGVELAGLWIVRLLLTLITCLCGQLVFERVFRIPRRCL